MQYNIFTSLQMSKKHENYSALEYITIFTTIFILNLYWNQIMKLHK